MQSQKNQEVAGSEKSEPRKNSEIIPGKSSSDLLLDFGVGRRYIYADINKSRCAKQITNYLSKFSSGEWARKGVFMLGPVGTGKTSNLSIILKKICKLHRSVKPNFKEPLTVIWTTTNQITFAIHNKDFEFIKSCKRSLYLFMDDFGKEYQTDFSFSEFEEIIEYRYANFRPMYITTNLTPEQISSKKLARIIDRYRECCYCFQIPGTSMRIE